MAIESRCVTFRVMAYIRTFPFLFLIVPTVLSSFVACNRGESTAGTSHSEQLVNEFPRYAGLWISDHYGDEIPTIFSINITGEIETLISEPKNSDQPRPLPLQWDGNVAYMTQKYGGSELRTWLHLSADDVLILSFSRDPLIGLHSTPFYRPSAEEGTAKLAEYRERFDHPEHVRERLKAAVKGRWIWVDYTKFQDNEVAELKSAADYPDYQVVARGDGKTWKVFSPKVLDFQIADASVTTERGDTLKINDGAATESHLYFSGLRNFVSFSLNEWAIQGWDPDGRRYFIKSATDSELVLYLASFQYDTSANLSSYISSKIREEFRFRRARIPLCDGRCP